ncbi:hypothetical protein NSS60_02030 [Anoxybacillus sp. FSL W8-0382]|uniref:hypothetical protein n=1 Tax=Anoxybacillus TaxID=150247 RepID=UPI0007D8D8F7|nr:hypothetical protein [Anoxybacillus flavithermus]
MSIPEHHLCQIVYLAVKYRTVPGTVRQISEGKNNTIRLKNVDLEKIRRKELFSEAAKNDYQNLYLSYFEESDFYNKDKGYEYFIIPSDYEGFIYVSNTNTNLYYMYLYPEMMGPTRPYWIKKLN